VEGLVNEEADYFLWEKFTTKPIVDKGIFRRVGNCPTPWPCFVIAAREELLQDDLESVNTILKIINKTTIGFKNIPKIDKIIARRYKQQLEDVQDWLSITEWSQNLPDEQTIKTIQEKLFELGIIPKKVEYKNLIFNT